MGHRKEKGATKDYFIFCGSFYLKRSSGSAKDLGSDLIDILKPNTKVVVNKPLIT